MLQRQIGLLISAVATGFNADLGSVIQVHTILSEAVAEVPVEAYRSQAEEDALTGLRNRRAMEFDVSSLVKSETPFTYASIDLDGLKVINDSQGHDTGDKVLINFSLNLRVSVQTDRGIAYRYGGDEFAAIMATANVDLRAIMQELESRQDVPPFSWGTAMWPGEDEDPASVQSTADRRMYDMKAEHRAPRPGWS